MAMSDNLVRNKMLEVERERLEVEKKKLDALKDIIGIGTCIQTTLEIMAEKAAGVEITEKDFKDASDYIYEVMDTIEKRWSE